MHVPEIPHKAVLFIVNRNYKHAVLLNDENYHALYEAVRFAWRVDKSRVEKAEYVLAVYHGNIIGAFVADEWLVATEENFPGRKVVSEPKPKRRYGFVGHNAPPEIQDLYVGMPVPDRMRTPGAANPVKYANC